MISVIITSYNRKKFLKTAVESVLSQDFKDYEITVVVNFNDLDEYLKEKGVNTIHVDRREVGVKIYEALKTINGEIVALLDDDDVFLQGKLRSIQEAFSNDIDFYRNEVVAIDSEGNEINSPFDRSEIRKIVRAGDHAIVDKRGVYKIQVQRRSPDF
ncbi:glycosyltransferase family A protein [Acidianus sp. RZ1]|uniref:glycosyltransferase family A protein n=1 Tax=Acidianus sp. RZ1 TaxID=1540082 RepID=UPI0014919852|nr:glycosyltransferase family 2 protein [Acidianus sp. RZ1]